MRVVDLPTPRAFLPLLERARYYGIHGGRGSGKSNFVAETVVEQSIIAKQDVVCLRETQKSLKFSVKKLIESKIEAMNAGAYFDVQDKIIKSVRGGVIIFEGMQNHTADSIKSLEGFDIAWFEEAQSASQKSLDLLRPTIRKPGSRLVFTWNPNEPTDPIEQLLRPKDAAPPPDSIVVEVNWQDNPWFPDELRKEMEYDRGRDPDKYRHVWEGQFASNSEARVFRNWLVEEFDSDPTATFRLGADWGFATDPTVLVRCYIDGRRLYVDHEAYMVGCEIDQTPDLFDRIPDARRWFITADSARPETISYMRRHGYPKINEAIKGAGSVEDGVEFLKSFDIVVHPRCTHTIAELTHYSYKVDDLTGKVLPVLADKDNHVIDALRYACEGARRAQLVKRGEAKLPRRSHAHAGHSLGWMA